MLVTQVMALVPVLAVAALLVLSIVARRLWLEHRRYGEFVRVLEKQRATEPLRAISAVQGGAIAQRPAPLRPRVERATGPRHSAGARARRFRVVEN